MAEELIVEEAAKEVVDLAVESTSTTSGKVALVIGGACLGAIVSYFVTKKYLESKYDNIAEEEIAAMRDHYLAKEKALSEKKPLDDVMAEHGYTSKLEGPDETVWVKIVPEDEREVVLEGEVLEEGEDPKNVFRNYHDIWDYEVELPTRQDDVPYVIHKDEYFAQERDYEQITLTYFEGDDVLSDSNDTPIDDQDAMVCLGNLSKFGHGSGDPNVVYVRNVELELEIEIVHSDGLYSEEVHGISDDGLKHSDKRAKRELRTRRRRQKDDI